MRVLIIEDNSEFRETLKASLLSEGLIVDTAEEGQKGLFMALTNNYDLILLDNILPHKNAPEICRAIREDGKHTPIMIISIKNNAEEKANLLNEGADDYLAKPCSHLELMARVRALTRRPKQTIPVVLSVGEITLNSRSGEVKKGKTVIKLTRKEFGLLELFLKNKGQIVSRAMILEHVWEIDADPFSKTIETHILNLRKKLGKPDQSLIKSVSGRGYIIR